MINRIGGKLGFIVALVFGVLLLILAPIMMYVDSKNKLDCASYIEDIPNFLIEHVNDACYDYIRAGVVDREELINYLEERRILFSNRSEEDSPGSVQFSGNLIIIRVDYCAEHVGVECAQLYSDADKVAYHEMGHIILRAAGYTEDHHAIMDREQLCPGRCDWYQGWWK